MMGKQMQEKDWNHDIPPVDLSFNFQDEYIVIDDRKFAYTTRKGKIWSQCRQRIDILYDEVLSDEFESCKNLNEFEKYIFQTMVDVIPLISCYEDFLYSSFYTRSFGCLDNQDWEYAYDLTNDTYNMLFETEPDTNKEKEFTRFVLDILKYRMNEMKIIENLCGEEDYVEWAHDEYKENIYYQVVSCDKIEAALNDIHQECCDNLLFKEDIDKIKKKEKRNIKSLLNNVETLTSLSSRRIYFKKESKSDTKKTKQTYIIKDDNNPQWYKIGKSIDPLKREKTLQSEKPSIKIVKIFKEDYEKELHKQYKKNRGRGEWFKLSNLQLKYICTHYD